MNKLILIFSKCASVAFFGFFISLNCHAQQVISEQSANEPSETTTDASHEVRISNADLIKLATKAPVAQKFAEEEDYNKAKQSWINENQDAYFHLIRGEERGFRSDALLDTVGYRLTEERKKELTPTVIEH
jgi:hypothetical protein